MGILNNFFNKAKKKTYNYRTYLAVFSCDNCLHICNYKIPFKIKVEDHQKNLECHYCGLNKLTRKFIEFYDSDINFDDDFDDD